MLCISSADGNGGCCYALRGVAGGATRWLEKHPLVMWAPELHKQQLKQWQARGANARVESARAAIAA